MEDHPQNNSVLDNEQLPQPIALKPVCPYCGADPVQVASTFAHFPTGQVCEFLFCGNPDCRKLFSATTVNLRMQPPAPARSNIVGANGVPLPPAPFRKS